MSDQRIVSERSAYIERMPATALMTDARFQSMKRDHHHTTCLITANRYEAQSMLQLIGNSDYYRFAHECMFRYLRQLAAGELVVDGVDDNFDEIDYLDRLRAAVIYEHEVFVLRRTDCALGERIACSDLTPEQVMRLIDHVLFCIDA